MKRRSSRCRVIRRAQDGRRMDGGDGAGARFQPHHLSTLFGDTEGAPQQRTRRGRAQADHDLWSDGFHLRQQPGTTGADLVGVWFFVEAPLAPSLGRLPLEVLDRVGDVRSSALDLRRLERLVQQPSRRAHEGQSSPILLVARLLTDQHERRVRVPRAEHGLGRTLPEGAGPTVGGSHPQSRDRRRGPEFDSDRHRSLIVSKDGSRCGGRRRCEQAETPGARRPCSDRWPSPAPRTRAGPSNSARRAAPSW